MSYSERLIDLADTISARMTPLGADFETGCWGAEAARIARDHEQDPCDYYGFSPETYRNAIKRNAELPSLHRNKEMHRLTLELGRQADG
jgi:hypothetical protein